MTTESNRYRLWIALTSDQLLDFIICPKKFLKTGRTHACEILLRNFEERTFEQSEMNDFLKNVQPPIPNETKIRIRQNIMVLHSLARDAYACVNFELDKPDRLTVSDLALSGIDDMDDKQFNIVLRYFLESVYKDLSESNGNAHEVAQSSASAAIDVDLSDKRHRVNSSTENTHEYTQSASAAGDADLSMRQLINSSTGISWTRQRLPPFTDAIDVAQIFRNLLTETSVVDDLIQRVQAARQELGTTSKALELVRSGHVIDHGAYLELQDEGGGWPLVQEHVNRNILFVRQIYRLLFHHWFQTFQKYEKKQQHDNNPLRFNMAVTGCPGVGKSTFFAYLLYRVTKMWKMKNFTIKIVLFFQSLDFVAIITPYATLECTYFAKLKELFGRRGVFTVFDNRLPPDANLQSTNPPIIRSMLLASYREHRLESYEKVRSMEFFMPPWREDELQKYCRIIEYDEDHTKTVLSRFNAIGGIPRDIFRGAHVDNTLLSAIKKTTPTAVFSDISKIVEDKISHRLIHIDVEIPGRIQYTYATQADLRKLEENNDFLDIFSWPSYRFASTEAAQKLTDSWVHHKLEEFVKQLLNADDYQANGLRGKAWEIYACRLLRQGGKFTLVHNLHADLLVTFPKRRKLPVNLDNLQSSVDSFYGRFCMPWKDNSPTFDAFTVKKHKKKLEFDLFQMTLSDTHSMNFSGIKMLCEAFGLQTLSSTSSASCPSPEQNQEFSIRFIFVVPAFKRKTFQAQRKCPSSWPKRISSRTSIYVLKINLANELQNLTDTPSSSNE